MTRVDTREYLPDDMLSEMDAALKQSLEKFGFKIDGIEFICEGKKDFANMQIKVKRVRKV